MPNNAESVLEMCRTTREALIFGVTNPMFRPEQALKSMLYKLMALYMWCELCLELRPSLSIPSK
jgi:hypothetical protein